MMRVLVLTIVFIGQVSFAVDEKVDIQAQKVDALACKVEVRDRVKNELVLSQSIPVNHGEPMQGGFDIAYTTEDQALKDSNLRLFFQIEPTGSVILHLYEVLKDEKVRFIIRMDSYWQSTRKQSNRIVAGTLSALKDMEYDDFVEEGGFQALDVSSEDDAFEYFVSCQLPMYED